MISHTKSEMQLPTESVNFFFPHVFCLYDSLASSPSVILLSTHLITIGYLMPEKKGRKKAFCPTLCSSTVTNSYKRSILQSAHGSCKGKK